MNFKYSRLKTSLYENTLSILQAPDTPLENASKVGRAILNLLYYSQLQLSLASAIENNEVRSLRTS